MIRLDLKREPHWLDLGHGVRVHVRPTGEHRLSEPADLDRLCAALDGLLAAI